MSSADFFLYNSSEIVTPVGSTARRGRNLGEVQHIAQGALAARDGELIAVGPESELRRTLIRAPGCVEIDARGSCVIPGFVDAHTHAVFGRPRLEDYAARLEGKSYQSIAAAGGGIHSSVRDVRALSQAELVLLARPRLLRMLAHGSTTVEIKSGYGLTIEDELKTLGAIQQLATSLPLGIVATFLGAHEVPLEFRRQRDAYIDLVVRDMLPRVAGLAEFNDVFCEPSVFTLAESERVLRAGKELGLKAKIHADELESSGGALLACQLGAVSADHLVHVSSSGISALASADTVAVLLPATSLGLASRHYAPARALIEAGAAVAVATDFNPGSSHCPSMQAAWSLACSLMRMTASEGLAACTLNAAIAVGRGASVGSLEPGKRCDLIVLEGKDYREVPYQFGVNNARTVVSAGRVVWNFTDGMFPHIAGG